jgi:outer membrane protein assembly factor BamB
MPYVPSPLLVANRLYFTELNNTILSSLDVKTGVVIDRERLPAVKAFYASPIAAAGRIYSVDRGGTTLVLKQSDQLEVRRRTPWVTQIDASPVAVGKQLFLRGEKYLYCIEE